MTTTDETPPAENVQCIRVGDEYHRVENDEHELLTEVGNITEQCDNCGAGGPDQAFDLGLLDGHRSIQVYRCRGCGAIYSIGVQPEDEVVF